MFKTFAGKKWTFNFKIVTVVYGTRKKNLTVKVPLQIVYVLRLFGIEHIVTKETHFSHKVRFSTNKSSVELVFCCKYEVILRL